MLLDRQLRLRIALTALAWLVAVAWFVVWL